MRSFWPVAGVVVALASAPVPSGAGTLTMEAVFNRAPGSGPMGPNDPFFVTTLYNLDFPNLATGESFAVSTAPGEISNYAAGFPRDQGLVDAVRFYNNTQYNITSFTLQIVGKADEFGNPDAGIYDFLITPDPNVSAFWGDVNGDGAVGLSNIFNTITLSDNGKRITFSDGLIPVNGRFTDFTFSMTDDGKPFKAGVHAWFDGVKAVPEPATVTLLLLGLGVAGAARRRGPAR
jgi:hypothetical protein